MHVFHNFRMNVTKHAIGLHNVGWVPFFFLEKKLLPIIVEITASLWSKQYYLILERLSEIL